MEIARGRNGIASQVLNVHNIILKETRRVGQGGDPEAGFRKITLLYGGYIGRNLSLQRCKKIRFLPSKSWKVNGEKEIVIASYNAEQ